MLVPSYIKVRTVLYSWIRFVKLSSPNPGSTSLCSWKKKRSLHLIAGATSKCVVFGEKIMLQARIQTTGSFCSSSYFTYQLKTAVLNMSEKMTSKDRGKVVTEQKYSGELNEKWMTQRTDKLILPLHIQFESACKEFQAMCFTGESYTTSCTSQHSQNNTSNNPELKECARRPQPVAQLFRREHSKD